MKADPTVDYEKFAQKQVQLRSSVTALQENLAKRETLFRELLGALAQQTLFGVANALNEAREANAPAELPMGSGYKLTWYVSYDSMITRQARPQALPKPHPPIGYPFIDRGPVDTKRLNFVVCCDGDIVVGAGYRLPPTKAQLVPFLRWSKLDSQPTLWDQLHRIRKAADSTYEIPTRPNMLFPTPNLQYATMTKIASDEELQAVSEWAWSQATVAG